MNEELDSQLSAMFDDELPGAECELLARRLSRDEALKARWGRYALIGAVIRSERGVVLQSAVAGRVNAALSHEPQLATGTGGAGALGSPWVRMLGGAAMAAGVATLSILWLRGHSLAPVSAPAMTVARVSAARPARTSAAASVSDSYVVPPPSHQPMALMPPTQLADYVVAHSAYAWPMSGGSLLSSLMVGEPLSVRPPAPAHPRSAGHDHAAPPPR
ncbi:MAG: sigma-E factor negative regulatory protein [Steroidobacteraceae bacterium]